MLLLLILAVHAVQGVFIEIAVDENLGNLVVKIRDDGQIILGDPYRVCLLYTSWRWLGWWK